MARGAVTQTQKVPLVRILSDPAPLYSRQLAVLTNSTATPGPATRAPMHLGGDSQGAGAAFPRLTPALTGPRQPWALADPALALARLCSFP